MLPTGSCTGWDSSAHRRPLDGLRMFSISTDSSVTTVSPDPLVTLPALAAMRLLLSTALPLHRVPEELDSMDPAAGELELPQLP